MSRVSSLYDVDFSLERREQFQMSETIPQETTESYQISRTRALVLYLRPTVREEVWFEWLSLLCFV